MSIKRSSGITIVSLLFILLLLYAQIFAEVPHVINYQGMLTNSAGAPLNGTYLISFYLYQDETGGTSVWEEESQIVELHDGIFSVRLGSESPLPNSVFNYSKLYLEVAIYSSENSEWETISPRQQITSTAFALNSAMLDGNTLAELDKRYVNEGQQSAVTSAMIADNTVSVEDLVENSVLRLDSDQTVTGIPAFDGGSAFAPPFTVDSTFLVKNLNANYLQGFQAADFTLQGHSHSIYRLNAPDGSPLGAVTVDNIGYVGIGTGAPDHKLEVRGYGNSWRDGFFALKNVNNDAGIRFFDDIDDASVRHSIFNDYNAGENVLRITPHGNYLSGISIKQNGDVSIIGTTDNDGTSATLRIYSGANGHTLLIDGNEIDTVGTGRDLFLNNNSKNPVHVPILVIEGGSDLSERFRINSFENRIAPEPGMLVSIDSQNPGSLLISHYEYDNKVAGIISGAGGVKSGMLMGQRDSVADGEFPVALTGRVYCKVDADYGPIEPGDLLTTSQTPGHAMKVRNYSKAQGAIIGKAMTALAEGKGLVLVLVSLL